MQYFQIQDSSITQIDDELAKKYIQNSIFNTRGTDLNGEKITIFDLQKNSVIPYVKFLDTPTQS